MNIGFLGNELNLLSGSAKPLFGLMVALEKQGYQCHMLSSRLSEKMEIINLELINKNNYETLKIKKTEVDLIKSLINKNRDTLLEIKSFCEDSDLLICTDFLLPWLLERNHFKPKIPLIFVASNNLNLKIGYLVDSGCGSFVNIMKPSFFSKLFLPNCVYKQALSKFDHVIANSHFVKRSFQQMSVSSPITVLPVGITIPSNTIEYNKHSDYFLFFGWGSGIRGLQDVLSSFEIYRSYGGISELKLFLQGHHGYEEHKYVDRIKKLKTAKYIDLNFYSPEIEKSILLSKAVLLPFRAPFGYSQPPLTILESMALGKVVISTNIGSIPEIITNNKNGFLVRPAEPKKIADILLTLCEDLMREIGKNALDTIKTQYAWSVVTKKYIHVFESLMSDS